VADGNTGSVNPVGAASRVDSSVKQAGSRQKMLPGIRRQAAAGELSSDNAAPLVSPRKVPTRRPTAAVMVGREGGCVLGTAGEGAAGEGTLAAAAGGNMKEQYQD
jgi:hypothetical protein